MKVTEKPTTKDIENQEQISQQEQEEFAGLDLKKPLELEKKYQLALDQEIPEATPFEEKGLPRLVTVSVLTGIIFLSLVGFWLTIKPKLPQTVVKPDIPPKKNETENTEVEPDYRAKLALQNQKYDLEKDSPNPSKPNNTSNPKETPQPDIRIRVQQPTPPPTPTQKPRSSTRRYDVVRIQQPPTPRMTKYSQPPTPQKTSNRTPTVNVTESNFDPHQRWLELAQLGQTQSNVIPLPNSTPNNPSVSQPRLRQTTSQNTLISNTSTNGITPTVLNSPTIHTVNLDLNSQLFTDKSNYSDGEQGILHRRQSSKASVQSSPQTIPFGSRAIGIISSPLIWDTSNNDPNGQLYRRFAITLQEDFKDSQNQIAIASGTVLVVEATTINPQNYLVTASAIAIITKDEYGQIKQHPIPPGTILIQGLNYQPLIAQSLHRNQAEIIKQDILVGSLSALGRIGEVLTEPESTTTINGSFGTTTTTTKNSDPEIWQAFLDGFFNPIAERIAERSEQQIAEMLKNPNIAILPVNTEVSVVINGFISLNNKQ